MWVLALYFTARSFRALGAHPTDQSNTPRQDVARADLLLRKQALLEALHDLDRDMEENKLDPKDHAEERARLREETKQIMRALDAQLAPYQPEVDRLLTQVPES